MDYSQFDKERIISISDLIEYILRKIWIIISLAVIVALLCAGFKYVKDRAETVNDTDAISETDLMETLSDDEKQQVNNVLVLREKMQQQQEYVENSILMQIDPYNEDRIMLQFVIRDEAGRSADLLDAVKGYIENGIMADDLQGKFQDSDMRYTYELVSFESGTDLQNAQETADTFPGMDVFAVQVLHTSEESCRELADAVQDCLAGYQVRTGETLGAYQLELLDESYSKIIDSDLQSYQYGKIDSLLNIQDRVSSQTSALNEVQVQALTELLSDEEAAEDGDNPAEAETETVPVSISKQYLALGALAGAILAIILIIIWYVTRGTLNLSMEFQSAFHIPSLGQVNLYERNNILVKVWRKITNKKKQLPLEEEKQIVITNLKNYCRINQVKSILLTGSRDDLSANTWLQDVVNALRQDHITAEVLDSLMYSSETMEKISDFSDVALVETLHISRYDDVMKEIQNCIEQRIRIAGAIVLN